MMSREQAQWRILKLVAAEPGISQRQLAQRLGVSLGKTRSQPGAVVYDVKRLLPLGAADGRL
ncbi:MAG: winged helix-turn-helix transcriptional regulator [Ramlibacter sp.]